MGNSYNRLSYRQEQAIVHVKDLFLKHHEEVNGLIKKPDEQQEHEDQLPEEEAATSRSKQDSLKKTEEEHYKQILKTAHDLYIGVNSLLRNFCLDELPIYSSITLPPVIIQMFHSHTGQTIQQIEEALFSELKARCNNIAFTKCNQHTDIKTSQKLIVLSVVTSRVCIDAVNAIQDIKDPANTALVIVHIKDEHAQPKQRSTQILTDQMFEALGGLFDLAFSKEMGIYPCEINKKELTGICKYIMKKTEQPSAVI